MRLARWIGVHPETFRKTGPAPLGMARGEPTLIGVLAALAVLMVIAADIGAMYWIATRTGLYRWLDAQVGPPRRSTPLHLRLRRVVVFNLCVVVIGVPVQAAFILVAGIIAAVGVL
jgi:hypothetical protein